MTTILGSTIDTPIGPLSVLTHDGVVVGSGFNVDPRELHGRLHPARRSVPLHERPDLGKVTAALSAYFEGDIGALETVPVEQDGTEFQLKVWAALRRIPPGTTISYAELAREAGNAPAVRAAGSTCGRNTAAPIVPCHRVVGSGGRLGGYGYGLDAKRWLLDHERRNADPKPATLA
jgi:methylated-DNA-[protein]-cysteine S-methyltransferase